MMVYTGTLELSTKGNADVIDITPQAGKVLARSGITEGIACLCVVGSTAALTTCEFEPGLCQDLKDFFNKIIPPGRYHHDETWNDGNGHSHLRASLIGPSLSLPVKNGAFVLGTWQQIVLIDMDARLRERKITLQVIGE